MTPVAPLLAECHYHTRAVARSRAERYANRDPRGRRHIQTGTQVTRHTVQSQGIELNVLEAGTPDGPTVVVAHGLRDTAHAFLPMLQAHLGDGYRLLLPEHRGHGDSDRSDAYAMPNFILDLHRVVTALTDAPVALIGHSLGGHVTTRYAALYPELVRCLVVVEGLGPPRRPHEGNAAAEVAAFRQMLDRLEPPAARTLPSREDARARLLRNNPRLTEALADVLAEHMLTPVAGGFAWNFDARTASAFVGTSRAQNEAFHSQVTAAVCLVSGALSHEYWGREMAADGFTGRFAEGEMEARAAQFPHHEHHWFERSGHMVHYDEADRLGRLCRTFLEKHHE